MCWRQNVGLFLSLDGRHPVRCGFTGQPDLGLLIAGGWAGQIECKRPKGGRTSEAQSKFGEFARAVGAFYCLATSAEQAISEFVRWGAARGIAVDLRSVRTGDGAPGSRP